MFTEVLFRIGKIWKHPNIHPWMNGILLIHEKKKRKKEILPFATIQMDLEGIMLSEISQIEKDKYCMISLICGIIES